MCTNLIKIYNKSHYHNPKAIRLYITVPCGKCAECIAQKRAEWSLRSQVEFDYCLRNGGYVYFDTLTYNNDNIPRFRGHACFQRKHIQDFLKRVRKRIVKDHKIMQRAFRYFYVSEYGHNYKRPHYHILFFVSSGVPYNDLKRYIKEEWKFGFTDLTSVKLPFKGIVQTRFCCDYVAKYVTKPDDYVNELYDSMKHEVSKRDFQRFFNPFHQQSTGFGESLLFDPKNLQNFKECFCVMNREKYTLPMYYVRKLFYTKVTNEDGSESWRLNKEGLQFIPQYKYNLYEQFTEDIRSFVDSVPQWLNIPKVFNTVKKFILDNSTFFPEDNSQDFSGIEFIKCYLSRFDSKFVSDYCFWKRFQQGFQILDINFNPLTDVVKEEDELICFDVSAQKDRHVLAASLDACTAPELLEFDRFLAVIRGAIGTLDKHLFDLTQKTKRMITYSIYGN